MADMLHNLILIMSIYTLTFEMSSTSRHTPGITTAMKSSEGADILQILCYNASLTSIHSFPASMSSARRHKP